MGGDGEAQIQGPSSVALFVQVAGSLGAPPCGGVGTPNLIVVLLVVFFSFIYLVLERGGGREKERERNINVWLPLAPTAGDLAHNPGGCPDWESNQSGMTCPRPHS